MKTKCYCTCPKCGNPDSVDPGTCTCGCHECTSVTFGYTPKQTTGEELSIKEALAWSDKHRMLSNNEGVRVVHIKQLIQKNITYLLYELEEGIKAERIVNVLGVKGESYDQKAIRMSDYNQALSDILTLVSKMRGKL